MIKIQYVLEHTVHKKRRRRFRNHILFSRSYNERVKYHHLFPQERYTSSGISSIPVLEFD